MTAAWISPATYIQGPGELTRLGTRAASYGKHALLLCDSTIHERYGTCIAGSFSASACTCRSEITDEPCTQRTVQRLADLSRTEGCCPIIGVGGGRIMDLAKAAACEAGVPVIVCPTSASTDAPCSALSVLYTEQGAPDRYLYLPAGPDLVLVDSAVIASSPVRLTVAGMGDALSTWFEARACHACRTANHEGGVATAAAFALAHTCLDALLSRGIQAKQDLEAGVLSEAVEQIIEANILLSGIGFENCGLSAAHAIHDGLTHLPECRTMYHGEKVAFGTLVQLILEQAPDEELAQIYRFCISVGLPVTLGQLGLSAVTDALLQQIAQAVCVENSTVFRLPVPVSAEVVADALRAADALGKHFLYTD